MGDEFKKIIDKFIEINKRGYVLGINNLNNSAGLTFERMLGKTPDSLFFPDYNGVEIKTTCRFSRYNIGLFSLSFDGPYLFESNYLIENYGYYNCEYEENKKLIVNLKINEKVLVNDKYYFELKINYDDKRIELEIYDYNFKLLEKRAFIYFDSLKQRIETKLSKLALIYASKKKTDEYLFFRYYKIVCYKYKNFETFLKLIALQDIKLSLMLRFSRSGIEIGKNKNKNMCFSIKKRGLHKLFDEIFTYEN